MAYDNLNKFMEKKKLKLHIVNVEKELKLKEFKESDKTKITLERLAESITLLIND